MYGGVIDRFLRLHSMQGPYLPPDDGLNLAGHLHTLLLKVNEFGSLENYLSRTNGKEYREWRDAGESDEF